MITASCRHLLCAAGACLLLVLSACSAVNRLPPEERSTAVRSAKIMGLNVAGVDLLRSNHGPVVMEVNSSPGLEGIETATGKNIAGMIIQFIENILKHPTRLEIEENSKRFTWVYTIWLSWRI